jgi:ubiquinone biosynthesis accessory factor UbiK
MWKASSLDELAARIGKAIEASPAKDVERNVKAMLQSGLARLDVVPRHEFDTQAQVLLKTREKLERLEARLAELEAHVGLAPLLAPSGTAEPKGSVTSSASPVSPESTTPDL